MKKKFCTLAALLSSVVSFHLCASDELQSKVELGQGYRHDGLKYSISGLHHKPNVCSKLDFKNMQVYLTTLKASLSNGTYIGVVDLAYGDIIRGKQRDSDYLLNNRRCEWSRSKARVSGDYTVDASAKIGRIIPLPSKSTFTPSIGYGAFWQHLHVRNGHQIINHCFRVRGNDRIPHLNDTYKTLWSAPFVDGQFSTPLATDLTLDLGYTFFYPVRYEGKGHWTLRHMHITHKNRAWKSYGQKGNVGLRWAFTDRVELGLGVAMARFTAKDGKTSHKIHGLKTHSPFRRAERTFVDYLITLSYAF